MERLVFYSSAFAKARYTNPWNYDLFYRHKKTKAKPQHVFIYEGWKTEKAGAAFVWLKRLRKTFDM
jgi:hypothetical protein